MPCNNEIRIETANVRGFHTNVAEHTRRFKLINRNGVGILCCGCYRPLSQGPALFTFLSDDVNRLNVKMC